MILLQATYIQDEVMIDVGLGYVCIEVGRLDEPQEELVNNLEMGPRDLEDRLVLFGIKSFTVIDHRGRYWSEQIRRKHLDDLGIQGLRDDVPIIGDVVEKFMKSLTLDFLALHILRSIVEIENNVALIQFLHKEILPIGRGHFME